MIFNQNQLNLKHFTHFFDFSNLAGRYPKPVVFFRILKNINNTAKKPTENDKI